MRLKTILVPVEAADYRDTVLSAALELGRIADGYIEGCPVVAPFFELAGVGAMGGVGIPIPEAQPVSADELRAPLLEFMRRNDVPQSAEPQRRLSFGWRREEPLSDDQFGEYARVFDIVVAGRPTSEQPASPRLETVECALFEGARPVLVVPQHGPLRLAETIVIAWNCSTEAARAVSFSLGLLEAAKRVVILTVEGGSVGGPSGQQLRSNLLAHGIEAEDIVVPSGERKTGEAILHHATELDAGLIVKGAYTQSRLRQRIFGGATSHLLYNARLPVVMAS